MDSYIQALTNLSSSQFSRDCYFYYVVPEQDQPFLAKHFNDEYWLNFTMLQTHPERMAYRQTMCREDPSSESDTNTAESEYSVTEANEKDEEDYWMYGPHVRQWFHIQRKLHMFLIIMLLAILIKLNLNHY